MLKILMTLGLLACLLMLAASCLVFGMLMLAFSTDGIQNSNNLPEGILAFFAILAICFLLYASISPALHFWLDHSWSSIFWPAKIGFAGAIIALAINFGIIIRVANG